MCHTHNRLRLCACFLPSRIAERFAHDARARSRSRDGDGGAVLDALCAERRALHAALRARLLCSSSLSRTRSLVQVAQVLELSVRIQARCTRALQARSARAHRFSRLCGIVGGQFSANRCPVCVCVLVFPHSRWRISAICVGCVCRFFCVCCRVCVCLFCVQNRVGVCVCVLCRNRTRAHTFTAPLLASVRIAGLWRRARDHSETVLFSR